jgi:hypothetical protein
MKSVNEILEGKTILFENTYEYPNPLNTTTIKFKDFHNLVSHHDIGVFDENSINDITTKYERRYNRLIETLKSDTNLVFIRYSKNNSDKEEDQIIKFYENIKNINPNLKFKFVFMSECKDLVISKCVKDLPNFIYVNLNNFIDQEVINETNEYYKVIKMYRGIFTLGLLD